MIRAIGFDPGWAKTGVSCVIRHGPGQVQSHGVRVIQTSKNHHKQFERMRASMDDERRLSEFYKAFCEVIDLVKPHIIGVEAYTIYDSKEYTNLRDAAAAFLDILGLKKGATISTSELLEAVSKTATQVAGTIGKLSKAVDAFRVQRGRGDAAKSYGVYTTVCCAAYRFGVPVYVFLPVDRCKVATGQARASKVEVAQGLIKLIAGLQADVEERISATGLHEHAYDAAGHAYLAAEHYAKWIGGGGAQRELQL